MIFWKMNQSGMIRRLKSYTERLAHIQFYTQVEDIIKVGIARYKDKYFPGRIVDSPFVLYEKIFQKRCKPSYELWQGFVLYYVWYEKN